MAEIFRDMFPQLNQYSAVPSSRCLSRKFSKTLDPDYLNNQGSKTLILIVMFAAFLLPMAHKLYAYLTANIVVKPNDPPQTRATIVLKYAKEICKAYYDVSADFLTDRENKEIIGHVESVVDMVFVLLALAQGLNYVSTALLLGASACTGFALEELDCEEIEELKAQVEMLNKMDGKAVVARDLRAEDGVHSTDEDEEWEEFVVNWEE